VAGPRDVIPGPAGPDHRAGSWDRRRGGPGSWPVGGPGYRWSVAGTRDRLGAIDAVVANAGILRLGTVACIERTEFEEVIETNLLGVWLTIRATFPISC
jgi:hypothetical protein